MASPDQASDAGSENGPLVYLFNGDADGMISQHILEMALGTPHLRITGLKREVQLLHKLPALAAARIHVFDISMRRNQNELPAILAGENIHVTWYDHHDPGEIAEHPRLTTHIQQAPGTCTAVIVHGLYERAYPLWAAMAAFGDNLPATAEALTTDAGISAAETALLRKTGVLLNYNAYGENPGDVRFLPAHLARHMSSFSSALDFCRDESIFGPLGDQFASDQARCEGLEALLDLPSARALLIPNVDWARRFAATWANQRILANPSQALAMIQPRTDGTFLVSIRAPHRPDGPAFSAADLAAEFPTGGGRKLAAGINVLPANDVKRFVERFGKFFEEVLGG